MTSKINILDSNGRIAAYLKESEHNLSGKIQYLNELTIKNIEDSNFFCIIAAPFSSRDEELLSQYIKRHKEQASRAWLFIASDKDEIKSWGELWESVSGILPLDYSTDFFCKQVDLSLKISALKNDLDGISRFGGELSHATTLALDQLQRVKKLHEQIVPIRKEELKGMRLYSKFAAGESSGGEFYDVAKGDNELLFILSSTDSYLASSLILTHFDLLVDAKSWSKNRLEKFLSQLSVEIEALKTVNDTKVKVELMLGRVNTSSFDFEGWHFGGGELIGSKKFYFAENHFPFNQSFFEKSFFTTKLNRGDVFVYLSPGIHKNSSGIIDGKEHRSFVRDLIQKGHKTLTNEIFFQLKKNCNGDFLPYDATMVYFEVDEHIMLKL